jgi:hypothetical protein
VIMPSCSGVLLTKSVPRFGKSQRRTLTPTCAWLRKYNVPSSTYRLFIVSVCSLSLNFEFFQASFMRDNADEQTSNRHLEAYLLWLFGYVMFCGSQGRRGVEVPHPPCAEGH